MLLSAILLVPTVAHAATGTVSVNGGNEIVIPQSQTTVSVPIQIMGSDALNGFDIQVSADPTILSGGSVSLTGSLFTSPRIVLECINGVLVTGNACAIQDASGVVHLQVVQLGANIPNTGTQTLFTINYNVVGTSALTPINFNSGCTGTSVSGTCVTISNGSTTPLSESAVAGSFANLNDFSITPTFANISTPASTPISDVINYQALGAFSDTVNEVLSGTGASLCTIGGSVNLAFFPSGTDTLMCSSTSNGSFSVTITATGASSGIVHAKTIGLVVASASFSSTVKPTSVTVARGTSDSSAVVTLSGVGGFSGTITVTATGPSGVTGTASPSMVTLTNDGSGNSKATTTLTVSVGATTATGTYSLSITGGAVLSVVVPVSDFTVVLTPSSESVPRGSTAASTVSLVSTGSFSGSVSLTATVTPVSVDNDGVNNIVPSFLPTTVTLTAGGSGSTAFFGSTVKIGTTPNPGNTATGNYVLTITATSGSISHSVSLALQVQDFSFGPNFCAGNTQVAGDPGGEYPIAFIGESCNTFTLTTQTENNGGAQSNLMVQVNSLGGLTTNSATALPGIQAGNPALPGRGLFVPEIGFRVCFFQTFFANGTQLSTSYIRANGPVVRGDPTDGCRGDGEAFPNDVVGTTNNVDYLAVTADALSHTLTGTYLVNVCGEIGTLVNCEMVTLIVINAPAVHQLVFSHKVSLAAGGIQSFKLGITNTDLTNTIWAAVEVTATGSLGDSFTVSTGVVKIGPNANANNLALTIQFAPAQIGETFTFTSSIFASAVDPGAVIVPPPQGNAATQPFFGQPFAFTNSAGFSSVFTSTSTATFTVTA